MSIRRRKRKFSKLSEVILLGDSVGLFPALGVGSTRWDSALGRGKGQRGGRSEGEGRGGGGKGVPSSVTKSDGGRICLFHALGVGSPRVGIVHEGSDRGQDGPWGALWSSLLVAVHAFVDIGARIPISYVNFFKKELLIVIVVKITSEKKKKKI